MHTRQEIIDAIQAGDIVKTRELLAQDASYATARDSTGVSAIMHALYRQHKDILDLLLAAQHDLDIFEAASLGNISRISELVGDNPALVNAWSSDGFMPLHFACFFAKEDAARLLLEQDAQVDAVAKNPMSVMPLHSAAAGHSLAVVQALLEHGAPPNAKQQQGWTALHEAAQRGDNDMIALLLKHGADPTVKNDEGVTPVQLAREKGHGEIARTLGAA